MNRFGFDVKKLELSRTRDCLAQYNDRIRPRLTGLLLQFGHGFFVCRLASLRDLITPDINVNSGHDLVSLFRFVLAEYFYLTIGRSRGALIPDDFDLAPYAGELRESRSGQTNQDKHYGASVFAPTNVLHGFASLRLRSA